MNQTTKETRRHSYDAVLPKRAARCRLILETLGNRELTASEITEELVAAGRIPYFNRNYVAPRLTELKEIGILTTVGRRKATRSDATEAVWARAEPSGPTGQTAAAYADNPTEAEQMTLGSATRKERRNPMNEQNQRDSIMSMARGAFEERVDYEMDKVIQNILDPNTKATAKRKITLTIELTPDDERRTIGVSVTAKSTLAATNPVATALYVTSDGNGELVVAEMVPQVPGQMNMDGTQQEAPKLLKLVQHG